MTGNARPEHIDSTQAQAMVEELIAVYLDVYASSGEAFFGEDRYRRQLKGHMTAPGWEAVIATVDDAVIGYVYGFGLHADTRWWSGLLDPVPEGFTTEDGRRTVAISELLVRSPWRRQGIARALHDEFIAHRREQRATLLVEPDNTPAYTAYRAWGWQRVSRLRPSWDGAPLYDALVLPLRG